MIIGDTTLIIDIWRGFVSAKECLENNLHEKIGISTITLEEIYDGLGYTRIKKGEAIFKEIEEQYNKILEDFLIIPININISKKAGFLKGELRAKGIILDFNDYLIGATALIVRAKKIITRNPDHFKEFQIPIETYENK